MGLGGLIRRLFSGRGYDIEELARRLKVGAEELGAVQPSYREFTIPKRTGGSRNICAPNDELKKLQRRIRKYLLDGLATHPAATGFEVGQSIVSNARAYIGKEIVIRMDLRDFFDATSARRVRRYFRRIGWNRPATNLLTNLCTYQGGLPQGAPSSPRLSNLVNYRLDARLAALARKLDATYTRYADDLTFSLSMNDPAITHGLIASTRNIVAESGYQIHQRKKLSIRRRHQQQLVTGLVVNERVHLPRKTRRWLRAVEHHLATQRQATLTAAQANGWKALQSMISRQTGDTGSVRRDQR